MADYSGQADIRGLNVDKLAKGFADEENVFKRLLCTVVTTSARENRYFRKTSGFLDSTDTTGITASQIANVSERSRPVVVEQSWTRITNYVRKYFVESPTISEEDIKDSDVNILRTNVRDLTRAVQRQVDARIYTVLTTDVGNTNAAVAPWNGSGTDPVYDLMTAKLNIRVDGYDPEGAMLLLSPEDHRSLLVYLISTKGANIPQFASQTVEKGVVMHLLGLSVVVSTHVPADEAMVVVPRRALTWHSFMPTTAVTMNDPGIGRKIRVWEEGEIAMTDINAANKITNTQV